MSRPRLRALATADREWIPAREATLLLGVAPATLRRWADAGHIVAFTTPGGHRRFERAAVLSFLTRQRNRHPVHAPASRGRTRAHGPQPDAAPATGATRAPRQALRAVGQHLTDALISYLDDGVEGALHEAQSTAATLGSTAAAIGMSTRETVTTVNRLRFPLLDALAAGACHRGLDASQASRTFVAGMEQMDRLLDRCLAAHAGADPRR